MPGALFRNGHGSAGGRKKQCGQAKDLKMSCHSPRIVVEELKLSPTMPSRGHFYFDAHPRVRQARRYHHYCWTNLTEIFLKNRPALGKFVPVGKDIGDANDIPHAAFRLDECGLYVLEALLGLCHHVGGDGHGRRWCSVKFGG